MSVDGRASAERYFMAHAVEVVAQEVWAERHGEGGPIDWRGQARSMFGEIVGARLGGDQDAAWSLLREAAEDLALLRSAWPGDWPSAADEAFEGLISAAIWEGILEDRRGVIGGQR